MLLMKNLTSVCPHCQSKNAFTWYGSLNLDRDIKMKTDLLGSGGLSLIKCSDCQVQYQEEPDLAIIYLSKRLWLIGHPIQQISNWKRLEKESLQNFTSTFGPNANSGFEALGLKVNPRVVFGWPALIEKILIYENNLDEKLIELAKYLIQKNLGPSGREHELRFYCKDNDQFVFRSYNQKTRRLLTDKFSISTEMVESFKNENSDWGDFEKHFENTAWFDSQRINLMTG